MIGFVFREFVDFVETKFGSQVLSSIRTAANTPEVESFDDEAEYDERYLFNLVECLHRATGISQNDIVRIFGKHLFARLVVNYQSYLKPADSSFEFMQQVENLANRQIKQVNPESSLKLEYNPESTDRMIMVYQSCDEYTDLTEGLMKGCIEHFGEKVVIEKEEHAEEGQSSVTFSLVKIF
mgnify:CR=1 FL=1